MNLGDEIDTGSNCDFTDAHSSSLINSLNGEEFSILSTHEVGLKFKISCVKRGCDDEVHSSSRTNLKIDSQTTDIQSSRMQNGNMEVQTLSDSRSAQTKGDQPVVNIFPSSLIQPCPDKPGLTHSVEEFSSSVTEHEKLNLETSSEVCSERLKDDHDAKVSNVNVKSSSRHISSSSLADTHNDACFRMDTLPNVSPDSGIVSFEGSPFGNESPSSIAGMENNNEPHNTLTVPMDNQQTGKKYVDCLAMGKCDSNEAPDGKESLVSLVVNCIVEKSAAEDISSSESQKNEAGPSTSDFREEEKHSSEEECVLSKDTTTKIANVECPSTDVQYSSAQATANQASSENIAKDDMSSVVEPKDEDSRKESSISGTDFVLSSPDRISQPAWRKKRVKKQKRTKSLLLSHKKSVLYNVSGNKTSVSEGLSKDDAHRDTTACQVSDKSVSKKPQSSPLKSEGKNHSVVSVAKKRSPGRPKGSLNKKVGNNLHYRTCRRPSKKNPDDDTIGKCDTEEVSNPIFFPPSKRPRGRPRKCPLRSESNLPLQINKAKIVKKRRSRKRLFTHIKKSHIMKHVPSKIESNIKQPKTALKNCRQSNLFQGSGEPLSGPDALLLEPLSKDSVIEQVKSPSKKSKETPHADNNKVENSEKSLFQDSDLDALLQSVNTSINAQFKVDEESNEVISSLSFDNPFKSVHTPSFPQLSPSCEVSAIAKVMKPKYKKPKLHVMMRKTKRRKKKKKELLEEKKPEPDKTSAFGVSYSEKRMSFFSSCVQPPKILATSRLNVFQSGTGVENNRSSTPTESEHPDGFDRRSKRKRRLLNFKSKHKNIIDPVFAADLDMMVSGLHDMTISEDSNDNFIKVRPGEMPLPTIFRVIKIDVSKKMKDRVFVSEPMVVDSPKPVKFKKEQPFPELSATVLKNSSKGVRKKSCSDLTGDSKDQLSLSDTSDQCLPPKKRHRMVNIESVISQSSPTVNSGELATPAGKEAQTLAEKRKGRRPKKSYAPEMSTKPGLITSKSLEQELTIDTSSSSGPCSSIGAQTPSPCPSRLSTRSSTIPSISSPSPTGSCGFRSRYSLKNGLLACPSHSLSASGQDDSSSCAECQLIRQSASSLSPTNARATPLVQRSLSTQLTVDPINSLDHAESKLESSPFFSRTKENIIRRTPKNRRKSSTQSAEDSDSSPPRLEKSCAPLIDLHDLQAEHSAPPEILPVKALSSPQRRSTYRRPQSLAKSNLQSGASGKSSPGFSQQRPSRQSLNRSAAFSNSEFNLCNIPSKSSQSSTSRSVISDPKDSDWQPLPLKFCTKRKLVEEIQAVLQDDSSDSDSLGYSEGEGQELSDPSITVQGPVSGQPPRKRYQRVGLFSDFYKDDEPRKRCETMVRCRDKLTYVKQEHEYGLMPMPIHIGSFYMKEVRDFKLPYDIWWQDVHHQLPKRLEPKIKFRTIKSNVYSDSKVNSRKVEHPMCNCKPSPSGSKGCLDECLNRMIYTECSPTNCPLGVDCANQRIQKHEWANGIEKFLTADRGYGVRVTKPVKAGQFLLEYLGEVISETEFRRRMMEEYSEECHHYALHLNSGTIIDGYRMGNTGRYVNHSCQPNCEMQKWNVNGLYRMVLFALRDIQAYEELVYDYNFDAFNQETQQECRCGSSECRGVIGGKAQRTNGLNRMEKVDDLKDKRKSKWMNKKSKEKKQLPESMPVQPPTKPMTYKERCYARKHRTFLIRNVDRVRNQRHPGQVLPIPKEEVGAMGKVNCVSSDLLLANLSEGTVKTRLAALAKDNPEVLRIHRLAQLFDKMLTELLSLKNEDGSCMVTPLMSLPSRKKQFSYYQVVKDPIDLSMIKQRVKTGMYHHLSSFNADVMLLFTNVELYCGHKSDLGQVILKLRRIFNCVKQEMASQLDEEMGPGTAKAYMDTDLEKLEQAALKNFKEPEEDIIRCICGVTRDEGLMLQCEKCMKWQHCDCVQANGEEEHYLCDRCEPRYYDPEIPLPANRTNGLPDCTHFMTLVKDDMQYAVGDCVYVMRDCKRTASGTPLRSSHRLMAATNPDSLDVFRIEQLWKDPKGERFASGTPYLRPQETFHEPTRKFFHNELFRTPNYEIIPLDLVMGKCVVLDPNTYSKGRPKAVKEQDVYICEYRVDKTAHLFHKIKEIWYPLNTSKFCFDWFDTKLNLKRTFTPHEVPEEYKRRAERNFAAANSSKVEPGESAVEKKHDVKKVGKHQILNGKVKVDESLKHDVKLKAEVKVNVKKGLLKKEFQETSGMGKPDIAKLMELKRQEKRQRLDRLLNKLLLNIPGKQKIDLSYLLDGGKRIRKKLVK